jgi:hypothetical protein
MTWFFSLAAWWNPPCTPAPSLPDKLQVRVETPPSGGVFYCQ